MVQKLLNSFRNRLEASNFALPLIDFLTQRYWYQKFIYKIFEKKTALIERERKYSFAIEVSSYCNAACTFCPNSFMKRHKNSMDMETFETIVKRIKDEGITPRQFNLTGTGEPLIDKTIFEKIALLKDSFPAAEVFFPTNLALASDEIIEKIVLSKLDNVSISLNANNAKDYKRIMRLDFEKTLEKLERLIKRRNETNSKLKIFLKLAANPLNKNTISAFIRRWEGRVDEIGISWIHSWAGAIKDKAAKSNKRVRYPCKSLFEQIIIHSNGNVAMCCVDYEGKVVGGNIKEKGILESFYGDNLTKIRDRHRAGDIHSIKMCANCRFSERGLYWLSK